MKKHFSFILLLALMLSVFSMGYADTVTIGDGTATTRRLPIDGYYHFTYSQQIYTQSQINYAGDITKIRFYYASGSLTNSEEWRIYLGHTQKTEFTSTSDWETPADLTEVYDGDVSSLLPTPGNWMEITLTTPFNYNNSDNLIVAVHQYTPGYTGSYLYCGAFTSGTNTGMYYRNDSIDFDISNPGAAYSTMYSDINRIQLVFPATAAPDAPVLVAPINGAQVHNGQSLSWTLPAGSEDATGYDVYIDGIRVSYDQPSTSYTLSGLDTGTHTWYVVARNTVGDSPVSDTWAFEILDGVIIGEGTSTHRFPFNAYYGYGRSIGLYTADQIGQNGLITSLGWSVSTSGSALVPYEIYIKPTTETAQTQMTWNDFIDGITPVKVGNYTFNSTGWHEFTLDSPYIYNGGNLLIGVKVNYGGGGAGYSDAPIFYHSTGTTASHQQWQRDNSIPDSDNGNLNTNLPNLLIKVSPIPPDPVFAINPADHDFGRLVINTTSSQTFTISNNGGGTLNVSAIILDNPSEGFTAENVNIPADLSTGQTTTFDIQYAPTAAGTHSATFTILHTNGTTDVTVSGECYDPTITSFPYLEDFDGTWTGTPAAPTDWTVINANNDGYTWRQSSQYISPTHSAPYAAHGMGNTDDWLITPAINPSADIRLKWWDKVENSIRINSYKVMISTTTPEIASFTELLDVNCNNTTWTEHELNLDNYTGQTFYLAFYQYASATTYHGFGIDDFLLEEIPQAPIFTYTPAALDFTPVRVNTATDYMNVRVTNTGVGTLSLSANDISITGAGEAMFEIDPNFVSLELTANQYGDIPVRYNPTAAGAHTATLRMAYAGNNYDVALSGRAAGENALFESFEDTPFPPTGWQTTWTRSTLQYRYGSASAYKYVSDSTQHLLITPMLAVEPDSRLYFWAYCSSTSGSLELVFSQDGINWTLLDIINFPTASTWFEHDIDLGTLNGNYYLALRNTASGSYYADMFIGPDLAAIAPDAPTLTAPADNATDVAIRPVFTWTAANTGGVPTSYNIYCDGENPPTTLIGSSTSTSFTATAALPYSSTLYWTVTAVNDTGESAQATPRSFTTVADPTIYDLPWLEDFTDSTFPPTNWSRYTGLYPDESLTPTTSGWTRTAFANVTNPANYSARLNIWSTTTKYWLVTPPISIPASAHQLEFDLAITYWSNTAPLKPGEQQDDRFIVFIADNPGMVDATELRIWDNVNSPYVFDDISATGESHIIDLSAHSGVRYIAFYGESTASGGDNYLFVDNVLVRETPTDPIFAYTPTEINFGTVMYNTPSAPMNVTVSNTGAGVITLNASDISIIGANAADFSFGTANLPANLATGQSVDIPITVNGTTEGSVSATLRMVYNQENYDVALSADVLPQGTLFIGDGTSYNSNTDYPCVYGGWYKNGREQYILTAAELTAAGAQAGYLNSIGFNVHNPNTSANLPDFTISVGTTEFTEFPNNTFLDGLTEVFYFDKYTPVAGWNNHVFTTPFAWDGVSNLVIQTSYTLLPAAVKNASTYYTTNTVQQTLYYRHDSTAWDTVSTGTLSYKRPNMMLHVDSTPAPDIYAGEPYDAMNMNGEYLGAWFISTQDLYKVPGFDGTTGPVAELNLDPDNTHIAAYTAESGIFDLTFVTGLPGTYYLMGYWDGQWHQANFWPLIVQTGDIGETVLFDIQFAAKGDVYIVFTRGFDPTVPVELSQFAATITAENYVQITWTTQSESNISGYNIYRNDSMDLSSAIKVSDLIEGTNTSEAHTYTYLDQELEQSGTYYYWLQNVELDGYTSFYGPVSVTFKVDDDGGAPDIPFVTKLENAYPNPFNPNTNIRYQLKDAGDVKIDIFNARGQLVRSFSRTHDAAGYYQINWDGRDSSGKAVSSGVYQYKMTSGKYHSTKKMVLKK